MGDNQINQMGYHESNVAGLKLHGIYGEIY